MKHIAAVVAVLGLCGLWFAQIDAQTGKAKTTPAQKTKLAEEGGKNE